MEAGSEPEPAAAPDAPWMTDRRRVAAARSLAVLGAILLTVGALALWVNRVVLQTPTWTDTSGRVLADPKVQQAISTYLVDQLYDNVDIAGELRSALPARAKPLAEPTAAALRDVLGRGTQRVLATPQAQAAWRTANTRANRELIRLVNNETRTLRATNGEVVLDLRPLLTRIAGRVGAGGALPANAGQIVLLRSDQLKLAQRAARVLRAIALLLVPVIALIFAAAVWIAPDRRRALRDCALGVLVAGLVLVFLRRVLGSELIDRVVSDRTVLPAAHDAWWIATGELRLVVASILFVGVVGVLGAWLAGPGPRAIALRGMLAGYLRDARSFAAPVVIIGLLLVWAPTPAARNWITVIVLSLLALAGFEALRRQTAREFPGAVRVPLSFPRGFSRIGAPPPTPEDVRIDQLGRLRDLHSQGVLDDEEFAHEKTRLLAGSD